MRSILACVVVCLAVLCQQATAQVCPTKVCNAYFENAAGGPMDCCKWDYNKGTCKWAGTPVSFKLAFICKDGARVLIDGNSQGPNGNNECRCGASADKPAPTFNAMQVDSDINGSDIPCGGQNFCKHCGGLDYVMNQCKNDNRCVAFTFEVATGCGFLKSIPATSSRGGWVAYTR